MLQFQIFIISILLIFFLTPIFIRYLNKYQILDTPNDRKIHEISTPRLGGVVLFVITFLQFMIYRENFSSINLAFWGLIILLICGICDDIFDINFKIKFFFQIIASLFLIFSIIYSNQINFNIINVSLPNIISITILFIFIIGSINSINLLDGLDGLVTGYIIISLLFIVFLNLKINNSVDILSIALLGSLFGFIKYNAFPARIFLGDSGALALGYFIVWKIILLSYSINLNNFDIMIPIILLSLPNLDTLKVMYKRLKSKNNLFSPDKIHLHHELLNLKIKHKNVVLLIHLLNLFYIVSLLVYLKIDKLFGLSIYLPLLFFQLNFVRIFKALKEDSRFINILLKKDNLLNGIKEFYIKILLPLSYIAVIIFSWKLISSLNINIYDRSFIFLIFIQLILLIMIIINKIKTNIYSNFYIFLNILLLVFYAIWKSRFILNNMLYNKLNLVIFIPLVFITFFIGIFALNKNNFVKKGNHFLTGSDNFIIILTICLEIFRQIIDLGDIISVLSFSVLISMILYFWFRVVINIKPNSVKYLFFFMVFIPFYFLFGFVK